jgi:hypothetical protein
MNSSLLLAIRADAFMKLSAMEMIVLVAGAPLVSILMDINAWYPLGISSILLVVAGLITMTLPETHPQQRRDSFESPNPVQGQASVSGHNEEAQPVESHFETVRKLLPRAYATSGDLLKDPGIVLSLAVFLLAAWGAHVWALLLQYVSQKFGWEFSTVGPHSNPSVPHFAGRYPAEEKLRCQEANLKNRQTSYFLYVALSLFCSPYS